MNQKLTTQNICAIIPAYNAEHTIYNLVTHVSRIIPHVIIVNDGSRDRTKQEAERAGALVLSHETNKGKGAALTTAFTYAINHSYQAVITLDADGQHAPQDIPAFLSHAHKGDIILGTRMRMRMNMPRIIFYTNKLISRIISRFAHVPISDTQSGFRLIHAQVLKSTPLKTTRYQTETEQLIKAARMGFSVYEIPITTIYHKRTPRNSILVDAIHLMGLLFSLRSVLKQSRL